ncbi:unnamed protein product [Linum trigynum]|uniref:Reverse transcriptase domain-containing protein n=2 Tax=Linum trigynum TaxID=586398 RepID=A0AAV2CIF2_9ROSI
MGFDTNRRVEARGFAGGIWVLWNSWELGLHVEVTTDQILHMSFKLPTGDVGFLSAVYGSPAMATRRSLWEDIRRLNMQIDTPWILLGDFNALLSPEDKHGGAKFNASSSREFRRCVEDCALIDAPFTGPRFTWKGANQLQERLDRAIYNPQWLQKYPETVTWHLPRVKSDHRPLLVAMAGRKTRKNKGKPFRFLAPWLLHEDFSRVLQEGWSNGFDFSSKLAVLTRELQEWNAKVFGNIFARKRNLLHRLSELEMINERRPTSVTHLEEDQVRASLQEVLKQEEILWFQKSRAQWFREGDCNTRFFHLATLKRRCFNRIRRLKNGQGEWVEEDEQLEKLVRAFYITLYTAEETAMDILPATFPPLSVDVASLDWDICREEVVSALKAMGPHKAPGKDGFHPCFFQRCWETVGNAFSSFISQCFRDPELIASVNATLLTLIPKKQNPVSVAEFRPIGLCNVSYKALAKCLANRLKPLMTQLIKPNQTSFVPGRSIQSNIIILQEVVHSLQTRKTKAGHMAIKIDLAKAYDRLDWTFLASTLAATGLPMHFIQVIMHCITSASFEVLWNGSCTESFKPTRGLRQGCPLSPYLFTLCIERLSHVIEEAVKEKKWKPIQLVRGGVGLTHLFFADDLVLFAEATVEQADVVMSCLQKFCKASGEQVSTEKSRIFFSRHMKRDICKRISERLNIPMTQDLGRYLGVPVLHGRTTKDTYRYILDRIDQRLAGWKADNLSLAGRVTLAVSVLNAIPSYAMQTAVLPAGICDQIDQKIRAFIWGSQQGRRRIHLINWETICLPKDQGGLGLRSARELNAAYHMKLAWTMLTNPDELWVQVLKEKYLKTGPSGVQVRRQSGGSSLWRGLRRIWNLTLSGIRWSIRDGRTTNF